MIQWRRHHLAWGVWAMLILPGLAQAGGIGFIAGVQGDARVVRGDGSLPAETGLEVLEGDLLRTGKGGRLRVLLSDDSVLSLGSNSEMKLAEHIFSQRRRTRIELASGLLRALVQKTIAGKAADFEVRSGNIVSGVRGTEFVVQHPDAGGPTRIAVLSGEVEYGPEGTAPQRLAAGFASDAGEGAAAVALAEADVRRLKQSTEVESSPAVLAWAPQAGEHLEEGDFVAARDRVPEQEFFKVSEATSPNNRVGFGGDVGDQDNLSQMFGNTGPQPGDKGANVQVTISLRPR